MEPKLLPAPVPGPRLCCLSSWQEFFQVFPSLSKRNCLWALDEPGQPPGSGKGQPGTKARPHPWPSPASAPQAGHSQGSYYSWCGCCYSLDLPTSQVPSHSPAFPGLPHCGQHFLSPLFLPPPPPSASPLTPDLSISCLCQLRPLFLREVGCSQANPGPFPLGQAMGNHTFQDLGWLLKTSIHYHPSTPPMALQSTRNCVLVHPLLRD